MDSNQHISPIDPISPAWNHMVRILFKPFAFKKWLALGFCAFLAQCGEQSGSNGSQIWSQPGGSTRFDEGKAWIETNFDLFITILVSSVVVLILLSLLVTWISSRGKFMLLDGIVKNRGAISEPWSEYKTEGNSLFLFSVVLGFTLLLGLACIGGVSALIALPDIQSETFTGSGVTAIVVGGLILLVYLIVCIAISFFVSVFMVPTMYLKRMCAVDAWKTAWSQLFIPKFGASLLLFLMMLLLALGAGVASTIAVCATCCIAALPYVSSVVLLPITVFFVCYALCYIQQFGSEWTFFKNMCRFCNYNLEGLEEGHACPECGK
jgi:hypothetical protein